MKHLILGYGYCGYYLAKALRAKRNNVWTVSRTMKSEYIIEGVTHLQADIQQPLMLTSDMNVLHYMIPPIATGVNDSLLKCWLAQNKIKTKKIIYYGSSAIYGDHQGEEVNELSTCYLEYEKQYRRMNAEKLLTAYGLKHNIPIGLLRIASIIGPNRLPNEKVRQGESIIRVSEAPWTNIIYINDLVNLSVTLAKKLRTTSIYNMSDGVPTPMGATHRLLAILMKIHRVYELSFDEIFNNASPLQREILSASIRLSTEKLQKYIGKDFVMTDKIEALKASLLKTKQVQATTVS